VDVVGKGEGAMRVEHAGRGAGAWAETEGSSRIRLVAHPVHQPGRLGAAASCACCCPLPSTLNPCRMGGPGCVQLTRDI
jgi:hypothetical protein